MGLSTNQVRAADGRFLVTSPLLPPANSGTVNPTAMYAVTGAPGSSSHVTVFALLSVVAALHKPTDKWTPSSTPSTYKAERRTGVETSEIGATDPFSAEALDAAWSSVAGMLGAEVDSLLTTASKHFNGPRQAVDLTAWDFENIEDDDA